MRWIDTELVPLDEFEPSCNLRKCAAKNRSKVLRSGCRAA